MKKVIKQDIEGFIEQSQNVLEKIKYLKEYLCNEQIKEAIQAQQSRLKKMLFIAVVGEVKAGKSTFINRLLRTNVCKTDFDVCTHQIEQITYAEEESEFNTENLRQIGRDIHMLKGVAILDTPGINVINDEHEKIAKAIIPEVDIVFFILHRMHINQQTTWEFIDFIQEEWQRRIFFVLTHGDEFPNATIIEQHLDLIRSNAIEHGISEPVVFLTSAGENSEESGFAEIRQHLERDFDESGSYHTKKQSIIDAFQLIITIIDQVYKKRRDILDIYLNAIQEAEDKVQEIYQGMPAIVEEKRYILPVSNLEKKYEVTKELTNLTDTATFLLGELDTIDEKMERCHEFISDLQIKDVKQRFTQKIDTLNQEMIQQVETLFNFNPLAGKITSEQIVDFMSNAPQKGLIAFKNMIKPFPFKMKAVVIGVAILAILLLVSQIISFFLDFLLIVLLLSPILFVIIYLVLWEYRKIRLRDFKGRLDSMQLNLQTFYEDLRKYTNKQYNLQEKELTQMKKLFNKLKKL